MRMCIDPEYGTCTSNIIYIYMCTCMRMCIDPEYGTCTINVIFFEVSNQYIL